MARRVFNRCTLNGTDISYEEFVTGSGEINITGVDEQYVTDDHIIHNIRLNEVSNANFKVFGNRMELATDPTVDVFGGTHTFYLDNTVVKSMRGVVSCKYDLETRVTTVTITGEVVDA